MNTMTTVQALAAFTDEGLFERLATAILREANPLYRSLVHPGVNLEGKTVKSPLDAICFVQNANPSHMIAVHHTTTARNDLENKWLHDPSRVIPRKGSQPSAPAGDLIKTAELVAKERTRTPDLRATLVLTTNQEPDEELVRSLEAAGRVHGLEVDLWSRARLGHFLDNQPTGQWLRRSFLGIEQEQLSAELLYELSKRSLESFSPMDNADAWIARSLDATLNATFDRNVTFLLAGSGLGKSVACYRLLSAHVADGGFGIVLSHEAITTAMTIDDAVSIMLHQLHPPLALTAINALSFCSPERPILLVVEDINRSGQAQLLAEKLAGWSPMSAKDNISPRSGWRLICPLWPETLTSMRDQVRKRIEPMIVTASGYTELEAREAIVARARLDGRQLSLLSAEAIARALGKDPLLIALHDQSASPDPHQTISQFVEGALSRAASTSSDHPATDYHQALRALAAEMLERRQIDLTWRDISSWTNLQGETLRLLSRLAHLAELVRLTGPSDNQRLSFRHDRVCDWLLSDSATELERQGLLPEEVVAEPFFAEVIGSILVWGKPETGFLDHVASVNPLALFYALRLFGQTGTQYYQATLHKINEWLDNPANHGRSNQHLRSQALAILAETDSLEVPALVKKFHERYPSGSIARLRNGDLSGGIELCLHLEPGVQAPWRDLQIEHAKLHHGNNLTKVLDTFLRRTDLNPTARIGALRLAGHIAEPRLALALEASWSADRARIDNLADYLWAFGECCENDPPRFLGPACDA